MISTFKQFRLREWTFSIIILVLIIIQIILDLQIPEYMQDIIIAIQSSANVSNDILLYGSYMIFATLGSVTAAVLVGYLISLIAATTSKRLRTEIYRTTMNYSQREMNQFSTASLITRSTNDISQIQMIIAMGMQFLIKSPILAVWAIMKIVDKSIAWSAATGIAVGILMLMLTLIVVVALPKFKKVQKLTDKLNNTSREKLTGLRVVRAFSAEKYEDQKFDEVNSELTSTNLFTMRLMAIMQPTISFVMGGISVAIYWIGATLIDSATLMTDKMLLFSDMIVFSSYATLIISSFMLLAMTFILLPRASIAAKRIKEVLSTKVSIKDGDKTLPSQVESIEFKNVSFSYYSGDENTLSDISFQANKGETLAIVGSTGSGKSTIVNLIPRFYDVTGGSILINGESISQFQLKELNKKISFTTQKPVLFSGSIEENITFFNENINTERLNTVLDISESLEFVNTLDGTTSYHIAQGGKNISGGQKQRLSIARSLYKDSDVIVFDDTFSALDYATERRVRDKLKGYLKNKITIIVAQRISTIQNADKIIILDKGNIVGIGTHLDLMKSNKIYREIAFSQLSEEEFSHVN